MIYSNCGDERTEGMPDDPPITETRSGKDEEKK